MLRWVTDVKVVRGLSGKLLDPIIVLCKVRNYIKMKKNKRKKG